MIAAYYDRFKSPIRVERLNDPAAGPGEVIIRVCATGICRSDWHGWQGHDADIHLPHVPGHEFAGIVEEIGKDVKNWKKGDRVTVPFCTGCGSCAQCNKGQEQICDNYFQPGFTGWGSFAEYVKIKYADRNLVRLPGSMEFTTAAILGCRFITSWRGLTAQADIKPGEWVAIHGCGGVGLSAIMIASALGAKPIAIDIDREKLAFASAIGAAYTINAMEIDDIPAVVKTLTAGGADVSVDALGSRTTCRNSILSLRKQGRHVQLGLLAGNETNPPLPMSAVISNELTIVGSHGMQAHQYPPLLQMISEGKIQPQKLLGRIVDLNEGIRVLMDMNSFKGTGVCVIRF